MEKLVPFIETFKSKIIQKIKADPLCILSLTGGSDSGRSWLVLADGMPSDCTHSQNVATLVRPNFYVIPVNPVCDTV